jgi:hypothetical protein
MVNLLKSPVFAREGQQPHPDAGWQALALTPQRRRHR